MLGRFVAIAICSLLCLSGQLPRQDSSGRETGCHSAKVMAGASPGRINITTLCKSSKKERNFNITISRYPLSGHAPPGIKAFRHRPPLVGSGAAFGHCRRRGRDVICEGHARDDVRMLAAIHVRPATRCQMGVSVTTSELTGCNGSVCPLGERIGFLFTGLPKGC